MPKSQSKLLIVCILAYNIRHETQEYCYSDIFSKHSSYRYSLICENKNSCYSCVYNYVDSYLVKKLQYPGCKIIDISNRILKQ